MAIKGILFDKDGTLLDYEATWMPVNWKAVALAAGEDADLAERLMIAGGYDPAEGRIRSGSPLAAGNTHQIAEVFTDHAPHVEAEALVAALDHLFVSEGTERSVPVPGLKETLADLKRRGLRLGIATSDSEKGIHGSLGAFDILHHFDFLCGYDSGHGHKPEPGMVHGFCEAVGLEPAAVAVVGDNSHDLEMGRAAGAGLCIGVLTGTSEHDELVHLAHHVLDSIQGLGAILEAYG